MKETHRQGICVILFTPYLFFDNYLRHFSLQSTNVCSALEAFGVDALYKFAFYYTYFYLHRLVCPGLDMQYTRLIDISVSDRCVDFAAFVCRHSPVRPTYRSELWLILAVIVGEAGNHGSAKVNAIRVIDHN